MAGDQEEAGSTHAADSGSLPPVGFTMLLFHDAKHAKNIYNGYSQHFVCFSVRARRLGCNRTRHRMRKGDDQRKLR
jgi:hypothetical protein